ncbi:hypothetical protein EIP86_009014 [Pleurotus ostreatoroseus]|nr:hypothetical protein EIP86_009014 [Pleurotus ostreatoroseus]
MLETLTGSQFIVQNKRIFRKQTTLQGKEPATVIYLIRQAGMSIDYFNQDPIKRAFYLVSEKVREIWMQFFANYDALLVANGFAATNIDISTLYINWMNANLNAYNTQSQTFLRTASDVLQNMISKMSGSITVERPVFGATNTDTVLQGFAIQYGSVWTRYDPNNIPP